MAGEVFDFSGQFDNRPRDGGVIVHCPGYDITPPVNLFGESVLLPLGVSECLGHVTNR